MRDDAGWIEGSQKTGREAHRIQTSAARTDVAVAGEDLAYPRMRDKLPLERIGNGFRFNGRVNQ
ncbi:unnamed protein product [Tuwongella immobilis]|uniref:Uncharacterized protein n=1 Tax=Tuwongella immobilis TaxID=692036 RepID=A0A6C2YGP7_9BACT|nr:unnamed protein product [Tuwongella immobilis]VTR96592.1 unnamed protein product [Tuwongella immobilis]